MADLKEVEALLESYTAHALGAEQERSAISVQRRESARVRILSAIRHLLEGAEADRADAERYRWFRARTGAAPSLNARGTFTPAFRHPKVEPVAGSNLMKGSVAQHLDAAIDAARKEG